MPGKVDPATVHTLLAAAVRAPAVHQEPWSFVILQDPATLKRLSDRAKGLFHEDAHRAHLDHGGHTFAAFADPTFDAFYGAGTRVVIGGPTGPFVPADCWLAAENLMLAAHALGLGTCVIGSGVGALNVRCARRWGDSKLTITLPGARHPNLGHPTSPDC